MIKIWGRKSSSNVQAVLWCLAELDLDYSRIDAGFTYGVVNSDDYLAINPNATIPTIQDGELPAIWETGAILRYLASCYGSENFWPAIPSARASVDQWAEWSKINIAGNFTTQVFWQVVRTPVAKRNVQSIDLALVTLSPYLETANEQLAKHRYLAGENFTLADIQFGHCLYRYFDIAIERKPLVHVNRYYDLLSQRVPFQKHVQVDYSELKDSL